MVGATFEVWCRGGVYGKCWGSHRPDSPRSLKPFKVVSLVQLVPRTAHACFHQSEASWGRPFSPVFSWVLPDVRALGLVTFASPFHRRQVPGCLREGGEVTVPAGL